LPGQIVSIDIEETRLRVLDQHATVLTVLSRTNSAEVTRYKAYGHASRERA
jgi:hypothetical protein